MQRIETPQFQAIITERTWLLNKLFTDAGFELRVVGGAVRDSLFRRTPKDVDFATDATPEEMVDLLVTNDIYVVGVTDKLKRGIKLADIKFDQIPGYSHGTVSAVLCHETFEITTLRIDKETTGRHAKTEFIRSFEEDAARRDLRFNAMSARLDGTLFDYHGGYDDLKNGVARFVGDPMKRIEEDVLRLMRYFRFLAVYGFDFDAEADDAVRRQAHGLLKISGERKWMEMSKLLGTRDPVRYLRRMQELGVTDVLEMTVDLEALTDVMQYTADPVVRLAAMAKTVADVDRVYEAWKLRNTDRDLAAFLVSKRDEFVDLRVAKNMLVDKVNLTMVQKLLLSRGEIEMAMDVRDWSVPAFPVSGNDLLDRGFTPGPAMGVEMNAMKTRWKDSDFTLTKEELLSGL